MASSSNRVEEIRTLLHLNLLLISKLDGVSTQMKEYLKPGTFTKPNRVAFEHTMHFLIKAYNRELCQSTLTRWPIIERRTEERVFKRDVVTAYSKIMALETDKGLLPLSPSFLSSPGGERLELFLCRLSAVALRSALERSAGGFVPNPPKGLDPQRCLTLAKSRTHGATKKFLETAQHLVDFMRYVAETAQDLNEKLVSNLRNIKDLQSKQAELQLNESTPLEDIYNEEIVTKLQKQLEALHVALDGIKRQEEEVKKCEEAIRTLIDYERPTFVWESEEPLDFAALLNRTADVVKSIFAGFTPITTPKMLQELPVFVKELTSVSDLMEKNLNAVVEMATTPEPPALTATANSPVQTVDTPDKLRHVCQMLEDANDATPPLEFRPATINPTWQTMSANTESPPIAYFADLLAARKCAAANGTVRNLEGSTSTRYKTVPVAVAAPTPTVSGKFSCTPARPRSEIPVKRASVKSLQSVSPSENATKVVSSRKSTPSIASKNAARSLKVPNGEEFFDIPCRSDVNKEDSAQSVLDLAVAVLCPDPSRNASLKEKPILEESVDVSKFESQKLSESMNEVPVPISEEGASIPDADSETAVPAKKQTRRSILDLIQQYKDLVPVSENAEPPMNINDVAEPDEWDDSRHDFSFGSDELNLSEADDNKFKLSPGF